MPGKSAHVPVRSGAHPWPALIALAVAMSVSACGGGEANVSAGQPATPATGEHGGGHSPGTGDMPDMGGASGGDDRTDSVAGYRLVSDVGELAASRASSYRFTILGPDGSAVTKFEPEQTKLLHFYVIRSDLAGFQHVHPTMATDGQWTASLEPLEPGGYRAYASFTAIPVGGDKATLVLGKPFAVPGPAEMAALPDPTGQTTVDGYTLRIDGTPMAGRDSEVTLTVHKDGQPVTDLKPYLQTYAHVTAFHADDLAFAHLHPRGTAAGAGGGPTLAFDAILPEPGLWRLFVQFQTDGQLHTAPITLAVG
ncbi:MAG: hypothetical protein L0Y54_12605 [Sporichthyaceae bacterium]|nr:hypothetical protein [Sporichthyaceae bacterium]